MISLGKSSFLIGAAIGSGTTALAAERGGADFLLAINAGKLRNMGAPSITCMLPAVDAVGLTEAVARRELLTQCRIPVLLGVHVWGRQFDPAEQADQVRQWGFAGAVNFPSCMHYSRPMQQILSRAGRGIEQEVELLRAVQDNGLTTMFYCANRTQARLAADAGLDLVCLNLGWNVGGAVGHRRRRTIEEAATVAREIGRLIKRINPQTRFLLVGGPIATADDLARIVGLAPIDGYVGGSTIERIPLENSIAEQIERFRRANRRRAALDNPNARLVSWAHRFGLVGRCSTQLEFLRRLRFLATTNDPVLLHTESGIPVNPTLKALNQRDGKASSGGAFHLDIAGEESPTSARRILFGHRGPDDRHPPALADPAIGLLVIHSPEVLPRATQLRLARALKDGEFRVSGTRKLKAVGPRVVLICESATTNDETNRGTESVGLAAELGGAMRGLTLRLPPLRERIDDLFSVAASLSGTGQINPFRQSGFSSAALNRLNAHHWPGNEDELRSVWARLAGRDSSEPIQAAELTPLLDSAPRPLATLRTEKERIVDVLWRHGFNRTRSAEALGMSRKTLYNKIRKYGLSG